MVALTLFVVVEIFSSLKEFGYIGGAVPATNTITVEGDEEAFVAPDTATITFTVKEEAKTPIAAQKLASEKIKKGTEAAIKRGFKEKDIKTTNYFTNPKYEYTYQPVICRADYCPPHTGKNQSKIIGYEITQTTEVKAREIGEEGRLDSLNGLLEDLANIAATEVSGPNFNIDEESAEKIKIEIREKAIKEAKEKAEVLAEQLDVDLVRIVSFSENGYYPWFAKSAVAGYGMGGDGYQESAPALSPGEEKIVSRINITYEIR